MRSTCAGDDRSDHGGRLALQLVDQPVVDDDLHRRVRIVRDDIVMLELGTLQTLKRFKDEVNEVPSGQECGMNFGFQDVREGDFVECFTVEEIKRSL